MLAIILLPLGILIGIAKALIIRLDLFNSLMAGAVPVFLIRNMGFETKTYWIIFAVTAIIAFIIQHMFKIGKVLFGIWGCVAVGILCYIFRDSSPYNTRIITAGVGMAVAVVMNFGADSRFSLTFLKRLRCSYFLHRRFMYFLSFLISSYAIWVYRV